MHEVHENCGLLNNSMIFVIKNIAEKNDLKSCIFTISVRHSEYIKLKMGYRVSLSSFKHNAQDDIIIYFIPNLTTEFIKLKKNMLQIQSFLVII